MAETGYNSKFEGLEVDARLDKAIPATPATAGAEGKGGFIPAPPAGSQDGGKVLLSNMTWGDHVTKQYIDNAVSAAGWQKQIVTQLPEASAAQDNVMYLVRDDLASTETKNVYNEYILVTDSSGNKSLESLGMVSTGVEMNYVDLETFASSPSTVTQEVYNNVSTAYDNKIIVGSTYGYVYPISIDKSSSSTGDTFVITVDSLKVSDDNSYVRANSKVIKINPDYSCSYSLLMENIDKSAIKFSNFMAKSPSVVTTLASLPTSSHNIIANVSAATQLSITPASTQVGYEWMIRVNNTTATDITQPIPTTGSYQSMSGDSVTIPANSFIEMSIWYINDKIVIRVGEIA